MRRVIPITSIIMFTTMFWGCAGPRYGAMADVNTGLPGLHTEMQPGENQAAESAAVVRMLIWRASLSLEVGNVTDAVSRVTDIAEKAGGFVESKSDYDDRNADLTIRVPVSSLQSAMASLEAIGRVTNRCLSSEDVTEQYVDMDARMKTMIALRDRLRSLLDRAENVTDILAIEKELTRVQGDIDSVQGRLKALKGRVDLATVEVSLQTRRILGPLGYVFKGIYWAIEKLFVIQE